MEPASLRALQLSRLQDTIRRCYDHVALFRRRMDERGLAPADIRSLDDLARLPFTDKNDLRDTYPYGLFAEPMSHVVRIHASSGTTGKPIVVGYTQEDLDVWSEVVLRAFCAAGLDEHDVLQNAYGYGLFTGGLGAHCGGERLGLTVIPISGGNTERQLLVMKDFGVTAICCTPSYFIHLIERIKETGHSFDQLKLRAGIFGAEPWTDAMRAYIQRESGIKAFDIYGLSEIIGPGVAIECDKHDGLHLFEDHFYPEIVDPATGALLPDGTEGELVITTLTKKAFPMVRYRTHDITALMPGRCACGRTLRRIRRIGSRCDDMMILRGVNIFPSQIETALLSVEKTLPHYQIHLTRKAGLDQMDVRVEVTKEMFGDRVSELETMRRRLAHAIEHITGLRIPVILAEPNTIARSEGKARRIIDHRDEPETRPPQPTTP
jgi:phenylacetate-CoA ligase